MSQNEILFLSLKNWLVPILNVAMKSKIGDTGFIGNILSGIIDTDKAVQSTLNDVVLPQVNSFIQMIPEANVRDYALSLMDNMIEKRIAEGDMNIPMLGIGLGQSAFEKLKSDYLRTVAFYEQKAQPSQPVDDKDEDTE